MRRRFEKHIEPSAGLIICTTPLQARIAGVILEEAPDAVHHLLYLTTVDSQEDRYYYGHLATRVQSASYLRVDPNQSSIRRILTIVSYLKTHQYQSRFKRIYLASIDSTPLRWLISRARSAELYTFDDGAANIAPYSIYHSYPSDFRKNIYDRALGAVPLKKAKLQVSNHFTIYPGEPNIVGPARLRALDVDKIWFQDVAALSERAVSYFIGQPFQEYLSEDALTRVRSWLVEARPDYYILHPREVRPLVMDIPILDKRGLLAEDLIVLHSAGREVKIAGGFSSVLLNLRTPSVQRTYLSCSQDEHEEIRCAIMQRLGCSIVRIS